MLKFERSGVAATSVLLAQLVIVGGCRGPADEARLEALKDRARKLGLQVNYPLSLLWMTLIHVVRQQYVPYKGIDLPSSPVAVLAFWIGVVLRGCWHEWSE